MSRLRLILPLLLLPFSGVAQFYHEVYADWDSSYAIGAFGRYQMASNAVTAQMANAIYTGSDLDRDMRQGTADLLGASNRMGLDGDFGLYFRHLAESEKGIGYFVRIADRYHAHGTFSQDLMNIAMFGNASYAGVNADLGNASASYLQYKQYEVGILKQWKKPNATWNFGFGLSLLMGNQSFEADFADAQLYTDPDGEFLDLTLHGTVRSSSISSSQYFDANGQGFSASAHVGMTSGRWGVKLELDDLGLLSWSQHLQHHALDTVAHFEGATIDLLASDPFASVNLDTIMDRLVTSRPDESYITTIPGSVRIEGSYALNEKNWKLYLGLHHRFAAGYFPLIYVGTSAQLPKRFFIDGRFAYGGFGSWNIGLEVRKNFAGHFAVRLGSYNLEGFVAPMAGTGQSAYLGLTGYF